MESLNEDQTTSKSTFYDMNVWMFSRFHVTSNFTSNSKF